MEPQPQKSIVLPVTLAVLVSAIIFGGLGYYLANSQNAATETTVTPTETAQTTVTATAVATATPTATVAADQTADWETYTNTKQGFSIKYPDQLSGYTGNWEYKEIDADTIGFRPSSVREDYLWMVNVYDKSTRSLEDLIKDMGSQFKDRKESRQTVTVDGKSATLATVTTNEVSDWVFNQVFIEQNNKIYAISNGAINRSEFTSFYSSFKFTK